MVEHESIQQLLTVEEVAERLRVHKQTAYKSIRDRKIPAVKVGHQWRVHPHALESYIRGNSGIPVQFTIADGARRPERQHRGDAGYDLFNRNKPIPIAPGERQEIHTGVSALIPRGYWARIVPRSSIFVKHNLMVHEGTIDSEFTGELTILVENRSEIDYVVEAQERVAQLIFLPTINVDWIETDKFPPLEPEARGRRKWGSTDARYRMEQGLDDD